MSKTAAEKSRLYRLRHPEASRARNLRWYRKNRAKALVDMRNWASANRDRLRQYGRAWRDEHRPAIPEGHRCPVCGTDRPGGRGLWHRDHDHRFHGRDPRGWREILCHGCNTGTGLADSVPLLLAKAEYLRKHTERIDALLAAQEAA